MLRQLALSHQLASRYRRPALFRRPVPPSCYIPAGASILFPGAVRHFAVAFGTAPRSRSEEHTSELQSQSNLVCRLLLEKKKNNHLSITHLIVSKPSHT